MKNIRRVGKENRRNMLCVPLLEGSRVGFCTPEKLVFFDILN